MHDDSCPNFQSTLQLAGRRWTGPILCAAARGARRVGEYRAVVDGVSDRPPAQRMEELEGRGPDRTLGDPRHAGADPLRLAPTAVRSWPPRSRRHRWSAWRPVRRTGRPYAL